jgi:hypothetical protein
MQQGQSDRVSAQIMNSHPVTLYQIKKVINIISIPYISKNKS